MHDALGASNNHGSGGRRWGKVGAKAAGMEELNENGSGG